VSTAAAITELLPGEVLSRRYRVVRPLGQGGMGAVYEVADGELHEEVALKLLHPQLSLDPEFRQRLREEVRLARRVSHPNVCRVHDLGQHGDHLFVTMELLRGPSLRQILRDIAARRREPLSLGRTIDLVVQLAAALGAAHRVGVVHRDVKPDNIIIEDDRAVLTDFGVAVPVEAVASRMVVGTPDYMAPELLRGERARPESDVYACALVAYELLAGQLRRRRELEAPRLPEQCAPALARGALEKVLARALEPDHEARFASAERFAEAISLAARGAGSDHPVPAHPASAAVRTEATTIDDQTAPIEGAAPRVATGLHFRYAELRSAAEEELSGDETRPLDTAQLGDLEGLERIVRELGGTVLPSPAGELIALFGAPRAHGDDVTRAARAAHGLVESCVGGRAGLHTGRVDLASRSGEALRRAAELAAAAGDGQVLASAPTCRHLVGRFDVARLPGTGGAHAVQPGLLAGSERFELPPLVGRADELATLERLVLQAIEERTPRAALVIGPAGAGKSRLRLELEMRLSGRREIEWIVARASPLGGGVPLGLLLSASPEWHATAIAAAAGGRSAATGGRAAGVAAARRWLAARAALRPVVIALEDVHWADSASIELLAELTTGLEQVPVALLLFTRSDPDAPDPPIPVDLRLPLPPLDAAASRAIAGRLAPAVAPDAIDEMVRRSGGNPFFLEELARDAAESGDRSADLPVSVELALQARLDRLPRAARRVIHAAAVVGREFSRSALDAALGGSPGGAAQVDRCLAELEQRQLIAPLPGRDAWTFHHALVRDVAYAQIEPDARRAGHAAIARHLAAIGAAAGREPTLRVALARHLDAAGDQRGACEAYLAAGELALEVGADGEARDALRRAEELSDGPDRRLDELCGDAILQVDSAAAVARYRRSLGASGDPLDRARLFYKLGTAAANRADYSAAIAHFEEGLGLLGPVDELTARPTRQLAARLLGALGWLIGYEIGDHRRGSPHAERAVALLERDGDPRELAGALSRLAANYLRAGRWHDRLRCNLRHLEIAQSLADPERELGARINLGLNYHSLGQIVTAIEHTRRALELAAAAGRAGIRALAHNNMGLILLDAGEDSRARAEIEEALALGERSGYRRFMYEALITLALLDLRAGDPAAAEARARAGLEQARAAGAPISEGIALRILAGIVMRGDRFDEADEALAAAHQAIGDDRYEIARTWVVEAKLAARRGQAARAADLAARARRHFEELGARLDLARIEDDADLR
jgi:tetratricopeptide (TPR) repeat protein